MQELARAKVNLALHVRGREPDGYHRIETLFAFAEDGDRLDVAESGSLSLRVVGPFASGLDDPCDNLVMQAARALRGRFGEQRGAALTLDKRLPVASGIGGGSADAAAALRLLCRWWGLGAQEQALLAIAADLGADVPACVLSRTARGEGRGDRLLPEEGGWSGTPMLLVNPAVQLSTAAVFKAWDGIDRGPLENAWIGRNDLEAPAIAIAPVIGEVLARLGSCEGARMVRMSGSGATCFALFGSHAERDCASASIGADRPRWWRMETCIR
jgi:4-diphosphocytidyl-2-C-methyl-D-erythritol kinase